MITKTSETDVKQCAEWLYNQHACDSRATFRACEHLVKNVQDKYKLLKKSKHRALGEKKLRLFLDTKVIFPTQTLHLQKPKQMSHWNMKVVDR